MTKTIITAEHLAGMTPEQQRVKIAQDVLLQIELRRIIPIHGGYFNLQPDNRCAACAIGSMAVALFLDGDTTGERKLKDIPRDYRDGDTVHDVLGAYFSKDQLNLIECAFEAWWVYQKSERTEEENRINGLAFRYRSGENADVTLSKIMYNIIDNNGTFVL